MTPAEVEMWREFVDEIPWLNSSHRRILRVACRLAVMIEDDECPISAYNSLSAQLSKLGATPADETRVSYDGESEEDPADEFFGRSN